MKNRMQDVRDHLVSMLELLGADDCSPEAVERAKAASMIANSYIGTVKVEIDARKMAGVETLPACLEQSTAQPPRLVASR